MKAAADTDAPTILFGAFDRHNFGDLLFPHIVAAMLPQKRLVFAGLAERNLSPHGGHRVRALAGLAPELGYSPVNIIHVGGELLTCDAWQAAFMLSPPDQVQDIIRKLDKRPVARLEWAGKLLGIPDLAPYALSRTLFPHAAKVIFNAVGGVDLDQRDPALRAEVLAKLKSADRVSVRDNRTWAQLESADIPASLVPDPAVMVAELFGARIRQHGCQGEVADILYAFPQGYLAVQFSADFGDDATLSEIAIQLDRALSSSGLAAVLFRAGAAPWHDDLYGYERLASRMRSSVRIFHSLDLWDICALIAHSRGYCGSSLHGGIVAGAFARPHLNLPHPAQTGDLSKQAAYETTWNSPCSSITAGMPELADGLLEVLDTEPRLLQTWASTQAAHYRKTFEAIQTEVRASPDSGD